MKQSQHAAFEPQGIGPKRHDERDVCYPSGEIFMADAVPPPPTDPPPATDPPPPPADYTVENNPDDPKYLASVDVDRERRNKLYYPLLTAFVLFLGISFRYESSSAFVLSWHLLGLFRALTILGALSTYYGQEFAYNEVGATQQSLLWDRRARQLIEQGQTDGRGVNVPQLVAILFEQQLRAREAQKHVHWFKHMYFFQNFFLWAALVVGCALVVLGKVTV